MSEQTNDTGSGIDSKDAAIDALHDYNGATILRGDYAEDIAAQFGVELKECPGELEPISQLDRLQPDNDQLGIGVGSLCIRIAEKLELDAEKYVAGGHGRTQRGLKDKNLPLIEAATTGDSE